MVEKGLCNLLEHNGLGSMGRSHTTSGETPLNRPTINLPNTDLIMILPMLFKVWDKDVLDIALHGGQC